MERLEPRLKTGRLLIATLVTIDSDQIEYHLSERPSTNQQQYPGLYALRLSQRGGYTVVDWGGGGGGGCITLWCTSTTVYSGYKELSSQPT